MQERIRNLKKAVAECPGREKSMHENGLRISDVHRNNHDSTGPALKKLQLTWWEFPKEHWEALREGSDMNFLRPPDPGIHDNVVEDGRCGKTSPLLRPFPPLRMQHVQSTWWCAFNWHHIRSSKSQK